MVTLDLIPRGRGLSNLVSGEASEEILLAGCWIKLAARSVGSDHRAFGDKQCVTTRTFHSEARREVRVMDAAARTQARPSKSPEGVF